ncbi:MAG: NTP transferase domain-containing protein [Nitrospinae bacterium]|nr:NTP transferase domain-containing protein [Nitrospinota bacterium]
MTPGSRSTFPLALLAGGLGTRLRPITETIPKALVEVAGEPFIHHQLRLIKREGLSRVVVCAGYKGEVIHDAIGDGRDFGLEVTYSFDGDQLLGTGGALVKAFPLLGDPFWIMYGDTYLDISFPPIKDYFLSESSSGLITVFRNDNRWDTSNVLFEKGRVVEYNKKIPSPTMKHIEYGLGILSQSAFSPWEDKQKFDLGETYQRLAEGNDLLGFEVTQRFYEIGSQEGLGETEKYLNQNLKN